MSADKQDKTVDAPEQREDDGVVTDTADTDAPAVDIAGNSAEASADGPSELEKALAQAEDNHDRYLRAAAELSNFRKRTVKMRAETRDDTLRDVLLQVGPMLDNFRRALGQASEDPASFRQGIELIFKQFNDILSGYGLVEIAAVGQPFDPNLHEAVVQVPSAEHPPGTVLQEMEKGYTLNDRVVRPTRVVVSTSMPEAAAESAGADTDDETAGDDGAAS